MVTQMPQKEESALINITMLLTATAVAVLFVCDLTTAQNPYGLKRPSYCSTCFSNDKTENYHCCFYFFRCCAESRLGSNKKKVTTPGPEYPDFQNTQTPDRATECKKCIQQSIDDNRKSDAPRVAAPENDGSRFGADEGQEIGSVHETIEEVTPRYLDGSELSRGYSDSRKIEDGSYSTAFGGRRYPYNVPRVYPSPQPSRNVGWRSSQGWNSNSRRLNTRYKETFQDSTASRISQNGRPNGQESSGDILWSRMEPVNL